MQAKIMALAGGAVAIVGTALAGGYYFGRLHQSPTPAVPPPAQTQTQTSDNYAAPQQPYQSAQNEQAPMPQGYESATQQYSDQQYSGRRYRDSGRRYRDRYSNQDYSDQYRSDYRRGAHHRVDYSYVHDALSPYGRWDHSDRWGEVWQPRYVNRDFRPYDRGHWSDTREYGWTWVSDYEWGGIPFHYGRWVDDRERGWVWIPGYVWGPGWVVWRSNERYTGWMPMPPDREFLRGSETYRNDWRREEETDYGYRDWYGSDYDQRRAASHWVFVDTGHVDDPDYHRYAISRPDVVEQVIRQTSNATNYTTVNNHVVNASIDVHAVEQASGHPVEVVPAAVVIKKPDLVTPVDVGKQTQIEARHEAPAGIGKPNSAPPPPPQPLAGTATANTQQPASTTGPATKGAPPPPRPSAGIAPTPPASAQSGAPAGQVSGSGQTGGNAAASSTPSAGPSQAQLDEMKKHHAEHEQQLGSGTSAAKTQEPSAAVNTPTAPAGQSKPSAPPAANGTAANNPPPAVGPQTPPSEVNPFAGPRGGAFAGWRKRHQEQGTPTGGPPSGETTANGTSAGQPNGSANPQNAAAGQQPAEQQPAVGRHFRRRFEQDQTAGAPPEGAGPGQAGQDAGHFPRGQVVGTGQPPQAAGQESTPPDHPRKHKELLPAAVEPGATQNKNIEAAPSATGGQSETPSETPNNDKKGKKRHHNDEPGGDDSGQQENGGGP